MISVDLNKGTQIVTSHFDCETSSDSYKLAEIYVGLAQQVLDDYDANAIVQVVSYPAEPNEPSFPDVKLFAVIGAAVGAVISGIGIFIIWRMDNTITAADNITEQYNVPVIGELMDLDNEIDYLGRESAM